MSEREEFLKQCKGYTFLPSVLPKRKRVIAFGDVHGDFNFLINCLKIAKVIDEQDNWIGGDTVVVQVGDQIDNCRPVPGQTCRQSGVNKNDQGSDIKILHYMTNLNKKAMKYGGYVYSLLGNHELMNVMGNLNYVSRKNLEEFDKTDYKKGYQERIKAFKKGNKMAKYLACTRLSYVIVGSFLFTHAGILPQYLRDLSINNKKDLEKINTYVRKWLLNEINTDNLSNIILSSNHSMFWNRILGAIPHGVPNNDPKCQEYVAPVLKILKVSHMVIGHTVQQNLGINSACGDQVWRVDIGGSNAFDFIGPRKTQILEVLNDTDIKILQ